MANINKQQPKILISACLLGERVRYNNKANKIESKLIDTWAAQGWLLKVCPEVDGGLSTPRPAAERQADGSITSCTGEDVSDAFQKGAEQTLALALKFKIMIAILNERSPSCGSAQIYNGRFDGSIINGQGLTTQLLRANGIQVFNQFELEKVQTILAQLMS